MVLLALFSLFLANLVVIFERHKLKIDEPELSQHKMGNKANKHQTFTNTFFRPFFYVTNTVVLSTLRELDSM